MNDNPRSAQIAHVLFMDIVGYSRETTSAQSRILDRLNQAVAHSQAFVDARAAGRVQPLPTGDGMALLFFNDVIAPAQCAREVSLELAREATSAKESLKVRMGIHSGLVQQQMDIAGRENMVGEGINTAQRVMDFGDTGHILLSAQYALWLQQFDDWTPLIHPLGEGSAKHSQQVQLYSLHSKEFGSRAVPSRLGGAVGGPKSAGAGAAPPAPVVAPQKVVLLYKRRLQPDEGVLRTLEEQLRANGHDVFVDNHLKPGIEWATAIEEPIRHADAVIAIVSPKAMQSEMLTFEIETAHDQHVRTGKPVILPVRIGSDEAEGASAQGGDIDGVIGSLIQPLTQFRWRGPEDDQRLVVELLSAIHEPLKPRREAVKLEPVGGAVPPESPFYVRRSCDADFMQALENRESILLVKGARQMGKTSLLAQGTKRAKELGWRVGMTDFQKLNTAQMQSEEAFYRLLAATLARQLKYKFDFENAWEEIFGANLNMENFLRDLLDSSDEPLVWFMDEVDKLFLAPFASDFFGLVRSWHNSRSTEPDGPWNQLTVVIAYATEAHLFIQDLNQSPFNVGRRMDLEDFNLKQTLDLNGRYGGLLQNYAQAEELQALLDGQPFLTRRALDTLATAKLDFAALIAQADWEDGPFSDHLKRILVSVSRLPGVVAYVRGLLTGAPRADQDAYSRLLSAGIIKQNHDSRIVFRCELYRRYLLQHIQ